MKILSFGSINRDLVYRLDHIVTPGETLSCHSRAEFWGGKGLNQCVALARAGAHAAMAGYVHSADASLREYLTQTFHMDVTHIALSDTVTGHAVIQIDSEGQNAIIVYPGANHTLTDEFADEVLSDFAPGDFLLLQHEINHLPYIMQRAQAQGMRIAFNPSPFSQDILGYPLELVDLFILNEIECAAFVGDSPDMADTMQKAYPSAEIVLTLGKNGARFVGKNGRFAHGIYDVPVVDTTAAGDTFTGFFLTEYAATGDARRALALASKASALAVSRPGATVSIPTRDEVDQAILKPKPV